MNPGLHKISFTDYQASPGVSKSMMDKLHPTPAHFKAWLESKTDEQETAAMIFGRIFHAAVLDGVADYYVRPDGLKFTTNDGKKWRDEHADKPIITVEESQTLAAMIANVAAHKFAGVALRGSQNEMSLFVLDEEFGVTRKCRIDCIPDRRKFPAKVPLIDLKTCASAEPSDFAKEIHNRRYHVQAAYYLDSWNMAFPDARRDSFIFIAIEKEAPFAVAVYELNEASIIQGRIEYRKDLATYAECVATNQWPAYGDGAEIIQIPAYAMSREALEGLSDIAA